MSWAKKILRVNLTEGSVSEEPLNMEWAAEYIGQRGLATRYMFEETDPTCDALGPDNKLIFATGPLTGTFAPSSGRFEVCTKSPATGLWLDCNCGGYFGPELKFAGYDAVIVRGKASKPTVLAIADDKFELKPAEELWGVDAITTHRRIKDDFGGVSCSAHVPFSSDLP